MKRFTTTVLGIVALLAPSACKEGTGGSTGGSGGGVAARSLDVEVGATPVFVDLDDAKIVSESDAWDIEMVGADVFTNGGVSGKGMSRAFGPLDPAEFDSGVVPSNVPFLTEDYTGGPFAQWFAYDNANHVLYGRYHVYGVRRPGPMGDELYKVQVLGFYGEVAGAPVAAIYSLRYAPVTSMGIGPVVGLEGVDATAGGSSGPPDAKSACLRLSTGVVTMLAPADAAKSTDWDLCFRRAEITVNGGDVAIGGVTAVDLMDAQTAGETFDEVSLRTADTEKPAFDAVDFAALTKPELVYRGDGKRSAFTDRWLVPGKSPLAPKDVAWLVAGSDGETPFLLRFDAFAGATATSVGTVHLEVRTAKGTLP